MRPNLIVDTGLMRKININEISSEQLSKHPYLSSAQAKSLIAYRTVHGNFKQVEENRARQFQTSGGYQKICTYRPKNL